MKSIGFQFNFIFLKNRRNQSEEFLFAQSRIPIEKELPFTLAIIQLGLGSLYKEYRTQIEHLPPIGLISFFGR